MRPRCSAWYKRHLGIDVQTWGGAAFAWADADGKPVGGTTVWSIAPEDEQQFAPSTASFMINYRVEDLHALVAALKRKAATSSTRSTTPSTASSAGSSIPRATRSSCGSRPPGQ